jgi:hypothetical protein
MQHNLVLTSQQAMWQSQLQSRKPQCSRSSQPQSLHLLLLLFRRLPALGECNGTCRRRCQRRRHHHRLTLCLRLFWHLLKQPSLRPHCLQQLWRRLQVPLYLRSCRRFRQPGNQTHCLLGTAM